MIIVFYGGYFVYYRIISQYYIYSEYVYTSTYLLNSTTGNFSSQGNTTKVNLSTLYSVPIFSF